MLLRKHEIDLLRISRAMRYGQLRSNNRIIQSERQIEKNKGEIERLALELSQFKEELREETKCLLFMINNLEERVLDT